MIDFLKDFDKVSRSIMILFTDLLVEMMRNESKLEHKLKNEGLIMSEYVLLTLIVKEDSLTNNSLAENANVTPSTMSTRVSNLEKKGLIYKISSEIDSRRVEIHPSVKGREIFESIGEFHPESVILEKIQILSDVERNKFTEIISKINNQSDVTDDHRLQLFRFMLNKRLFDSTNWTLRNN